MRSWSKCGGSAGVQAGMYVLLINKAIGKLPAPLGLPGRREGAILSHCAQRKKHSRLPVVDKGYKSLKFQVVLEPESCNKVCYSPVLQQFLF